MDHWFSLTSKCSVSGSGESGNWQGDGCFQNESNVVTLNEEDLSYMYDKETTPIKACGDFAYNTTHSGNMNKEPEERKENCLQVKRRRMLQFDAPVVDPTFQYEELSSTFIKSNGRENLVEDVYNDMSEWVSTFSENATSSSVEGLDLSTEGWIAECFNVNDNEMHFNPTDMNYTGANDVEVDISELCNFSPETEVNVDQRHIKQTPPNVVFKGKKSVTHTPIKLAAPVAYPFAFIKPCEFQGDTTLKDINERILTPPSNLKQKNEDPLDYPTSVFSGKPVVGKTKIHTDGGRGSITIMRTKG
ncbi:protein XRI1-like isoform X1 [Tripterygium wilfordii]|uniref:protein XRI1-like isoform X1 n=1 Tax=Tripterygium wilfordii TaxID=458696 RepID=UPI0018F80F23|nr:protein XRI1-like isoform X1 [Tripterygium wilfordii]